jgi:hypothetical protein
VTDIEVRASAVELHDGMSGVELFDWLDGAVPAVVAMERRTDEARVQVGHALWLLRRACRDDDEYGRKMHALADTHEVTVRTLQRWRQQAEVVRQLTPGRRSVAQREAVRTPRTAPEPAGPLVPEVVQRRPTISNPGEHEVLRLFDPDNPEELQALGTTVVDVGAERLAGALTVRQVDEMIGVLRAARSLVVAKTATGANRCEKSPTGLHVRKAVPSPALGQVYECKYCGERSATR